jgi:sulfoxide reductase heme-binding subunit YedZ
MRKPIVGGILAGGLLLAIADAIATRAHLAPSALPRPDGPWCWVSSRAMGVTAYMALSVNVVLGLLLSTRRGDRWIPRGQSVEVHQWLSGATLGLVAAHALLLLGDGFIRFDALDVFVPFIDPYRSLAVGLGVLGAYVAFLVHWSFSLRRVIGIATWRRLHYLTFLFFVFATLHGVFAGTDSRSTGMAAMYWIVGGSVFVLVVYRLLPIARPSTSGGRAMVGSR